MSIPLSAALLVLAIAGYALVNSIEIAVVAANRIRIHHLAEEGHRGAQSLERIRERQDHFFAAIVLLQNLFVVLGSAIGTIMAEDIAGGAGIAVGTIIIALLIALFGEITPKVLAAQASERYAIMVARPSEMLMRLFHPLVIVLTALPTIFGRLIFGIRPEVTPTVTEAELRMLIDIGTEEGTVGKEEGELLERAFALGERQVREIMVPRTEVVALETGTTLADFYRLFAKTAHSRFPVFKESLDDIVGIVAIKDVMQSLAAGRLSYDSPIEGCIRPAMLVPETKLIDDLLREMQSGAQQVAIIVDEFGGTAGIATLEMLLEEMIGEVRDEMGKAQREFAPVDAETMEVDGGISIHDANRQLDMDIPDGDYDTLAGFILERLGHIPKEGEVVSYDTLRLMVARMQGQKIRSVWVNKVASS